MRLYFLTMSDDTKIEADKQLSSVQISKQAADVLKQNNVDNYTAGNKVAAPHQNLLTSCFCAIGLRNMDIEQAKMELTSLVRGQWHSGMLPSLVFRDEKHFQRSRSSWQSWLSPDSPDAVATSGISEPPLLAEAVVRVGEKMPLIARRGWYKLMWPHLIAYHTWIYTERDPHQEGLALLLHPAETGMADTPPWIAELHQHLMPSWIRLIQKLKLDSLIDLIHKTVDARFSTVEQLALASVRRRLRRKHYEINKILDHSLFAIEDLTFNSILVRANENLHKISAVLHEPIPSDLAERMKKTDEELEKLWDPLTNQYYSRDFITHELIREPSIAALLPLYAGVISKERAEILVKMLENENQFGLMYPAPSTPMNSNWFNPRRVDQGATHVGLNWLIIDGLNRYGFKDHAAALAESTVEMVAKSGFSEYFDPITGEPLGADSFSPTAAIALDLLQEK